MKKYLLFALIALSTLTSCSNDDKDPTIEKATFEESFSYKIVDVKAFDANGKYYANGYDKAVNENSKITFNKTDKTVTFIISGTPNLLTVTSIEKEILKVNYSIGVDSNTGMFVFLPADLYKEGNVFVLNLLETPIKAKFEFAVTK